MPIIKTLIGKSGLDRRIKAHIKLRGEGWIKISEVIIPLSKSVVPQLLV